MPAHRKIPPDLEPKIIKKAAETGWTSAQLAEWLKAEHHVDVGARAVRGYVKRVKDERAPIAQAIVRQELQGKLTGDLELVDQMIADAQKQQRDAEDIDDIKQDLDHLAKVNLADFVDQDTGRLKAVHDMPENAQRAIASIEIEELFEGQGNERHVIGDLVKVRFWDKRSALVDLAKIRAGHMKIPAMQLQKQLLELRFKLSGAMGGGTTERLSDLVLGAKKRAEKLEPPGEDDE